jgi:hypothetical protein
VKKMSRCPHCGAEIKWLFHIPPRIGEDRFEVIDGKPSYSTMCRQTEWGSHQYRCPNCDVVLYEKEKDAIKFLQSE